MMQRLSRQVGRYALVGAAATGLHVLVALSLVEWAQIPVLSANLAAFGCALLESYLGNHRWTFAAKGRHEFHFPRFAAVALLGLALNQAIVYGVVSILELDFRIALAIVVFVIPAVGFLASRYWAFGIASHDANRSASQSLAK